MATQRNWKKNWTVFIGTVADKATVSMALSISMFVGVISDAGECSSWGAIEGVCVCLRLM